MDLTTRCPRCHTVFQASLADLQLRKGYIRCVQCAHIFDGYAEVVSDSGKEPFVEDDKLQQTAATASEPGISHDYQADFTPTDISADHHIRSDNSPDTGPDFKIVETTETDPDDSFSITLGTQPKAAQTESFILEADPSRRAPGSVYGEPQSSFWRAASKTFSWVILVLLVLLLAFQGAFIYRAQIAQNFPFTRPVLEKYCSYLNCYVPYLRDIDSLVITKSALKLIKPASSAEVSESEADSTKQLDTTQQEPKIRNYELQFNLRNLAKQPQEWPTVVLNLKDSSGQIQIKRNLTPQDYLSQLSPAMPAQSETFVSLPIELKGDTQVNGFHLDLFFP